MEKDTLILLSGGLDSAVLLASERHRIGLALFVEYGQPAEREECAAAQKLVRLPVMREQADIPLHYLRLSLSGMDAMGASAGSGARVVPARNLILLSHAVGIALTRGLTRVVYGATAGDHDGYIDCRPAFVQALGDCSQLLGVTIEAPLSGLDKAAVVALGKRLGASMALSWSCYSPRGGRPCGVCNACIERDAAIR